MAEPAVKPSPNKGPSTVMIVLLIVILIGGAIGMWMFLRPKSDDDGGDEGDEFTPGRNDATGTFTELTPERIRELFGENPEGGSNKEPVTNGPGSSADNPLYYKSQQAQQLIAETAIELQANETIMDTIRGNYKIGKALFKFNNDMQSAVVSMFKKLAGVSFSTARPYLTFPIYGTYEPIGKDLRAELQNILNKGSKGINLCPRPVQSAEEYWWLPSIELNLLMGTTNQFVPTHHAVWNGKNFDGRDEMLDFYKNLNGWHVTDEALVRVVDASGQFDRPPWDVGVKAKYPATSVITLVERWIEAIDHLDKVVQWEAINFLQSEEGGGWHFSFIDANGNDHTSNVDPNQDPVITGYKNEPDGGPHIPNSYWTDSQGRLFYTHPNGQHFQVG